MPKLRKVQTNMSKGELTPKVEGRPDVASYFEGGAVVENFFMLRQGGLTRRTGTRFVAEAKFHDTLIILLPFQASVEASYVIEVSPGHMRFYKDKVRIETSPGVPVEIDTPYDEGQIVRLHFTQSVDVMYLFEINDPIHKLQRLSDTEWVLSALTLTPPSFVGDEFFAADLTPVATTGSDVGFEISNGHFLPGDITRMIMSGASRAVITAFVSPTVVTATILDAFPSTDPIPSPFWWLRGAPGSTLDVDIRGPQGAEATLITDADTWREAYVGMFVKVWDGLIRLTAWDSFQVMRGVILNELQTEEEDPPIALAGTWSLERSSWSEDTGFPRTGEFFQGRLGAASTNAQPTTWWLSVSDDYENFAVGIKATDAVEYTMATRNLNRIEWMADLNSLFLGTSGTEHIARGGKSDEPIGGDVIPKIDKFSGHGVGAIQPVICNGHLLFIDRSYRQIYRVIFSWEEDRYDSEEITALADHISGGRTGFNLGPIAVQQRLDNRVLFVRPDGQVACLTYNPKEKVVGFTRLVTDGTVNAMVAIPQTEGKPDQIWQVATRQHPSGPRKYIEVYDEEIAEGFDRDWQSLYTDCAKVYKGPPTMEITGLDYIEGHTVDVIASSGFIGPRVVTNGAVQLSEEASEVEVGLHYESVFTSMRPAAQDQVIEGLPRSWDSLYIRVLETLGGRVNEELVLYPPPLLGHSRLFTGDRKVSGQGWTDTEGRVTVKQDQPYPMTLLAVYGTLSVGERD